MIALKHPEHGTHFASSEYEAIECEKQGWKRVVETPMGQIAEQLKAKSFDRGKMMRERWAKAKREGKGTL